MVTKLFNSGLLRRNYASRDPVTGHSYYGRGFIMLTHKLNYEKIGRALGVGDLYVREPNQILRTDVAAATAIVGMTRGVFTGKRHSDYFDSEKQNWGNARKVVNGLDRAALHARFGQDFYICLQ